jgi:hypothetical protein
MIKEGRKNNRFNNNKIQSIENKENTFSFISLLEKEKNSNQGSADELIILTDKIYDSKTNGEKRINLLLEKMICDKSLIYNRNNNENGFEKLIYQVYTNISADSFRILNDE